MIEGYVVKERYIIQHTINHWYVDGPDHLCIIWGSDFDTARLFYSIAEAREFIKRNSLNDAVITKYSIVLSKVDKGD